jgi:Holliday junction resolvase
MANKNNGKRTEQNFQKSCEKDGILCIRLVDSNKFGFGSQSRFTPTNIADFVCFDSDSLLIIELKSTIGSSMSFNQPVEIQPKGKAKPSIKSHQINSLLERSQYHNVYCGLLLDFDDRTNSKGEVLEGGTYYIDIHTFVGWTRSIKKKSINQVDAQLIGIQVDRKKLKTNYRYDIKKLLEDIKHEDIFDEDK